MQLFRSLLTSSAGLLGAALLTSTGAAAQGVFYVDGVSGSNSNPGTSSLSFRTIQGAINITKSLPNNNVTINVLPTPMATRRA